MRKWEDDQRWATEDFEKHCVAPLRGVGCSDIVRQEGVNAARAYDLDVHQGIDYLYRDAHGVERGIASRVQRVSRAWRTFTLRQERPTGAKTEVEKRTAAMQRGAPHLNTHAYVSEDGLRLLLLAAVSSEDLFGLLTEPYTRCTPGAPYLKTNPDDGVVFLVVPFDWLKERDARLAILPGVDSQSREIPAWERSGGEKPQVFCSVCKRRIVSPGGASEAFCNGCGSHICHRCQAATHLVWPIGPHSPEIHRPAVAA
jgi:hypothetical protein